MKSRNETLSEGLASIDPVRAEDQQLTDSTAAELLATIISSDRRVPQTKSPRRSGYTVRRLVVAAMGLAALSGGAAWAAGVFSADDIAFNSGVGCYNKPRLHGRNVSVWAYQAAADPVAKCAKLWKEVDHSQAPTSSHLVACTNAGAGVSVFPGPGSLCQKLGMVPLPADYPAAGREAARAYAAWSRALANLQETVPGNCRSPQRLANRARAQLSRTQYRDVRVVIEKSGPCALGLDARGRVIAVRTESNQEDRLGEFQSEVASAAAPLLHRAALTCIPPRRLAADIRQVLQRAGLSEAAVGMSRKYDPCTGSSSGFDGKTLSLAGDTYGTWKFNRKGTLRYERVLKKHGIFNPDKPWAPTGSP